MKPAFLLAALLVFPLVARANDSSFEGFGGTLRPTSGENKAIRMKRELVVLTANRDGYSTRAEFVFCNETGRSQSVAMGYPESNYSGEVPLKGSGFKRFVTWVDGRAVPATRTELRRFDAGGFNVYWMKTVSFAPHQTRRVRVETLSPYGSTNNWGFTRTLGYAFTGANWRGDVGQSTLELRVAQPGLWRAVLCGESEKMLPLSVSSGARGATFGRVWRHWPAQQKVTFGLERALPGWKVDTDADGGDYTLATVRAARTVRVGRVAQDALGARGFPTHAFTRGGVAYLSLAHLNEELDGWGDEFKPALRTQSRYDAHTGFELRAGKTSLHVRAGDDTALINGQSVPLGAPALLVPHNGSRALFAPLAPIVRALGLQATFEGEHLFRLERGAWNGR